MDEIIGERVVKAPLKIKNGDDEVLCIVYPQRRTVVLLDIDGGEHHYSVPMGVRKLRAPLVREVRLNKAEIVELSKRLEGYVGITRVELLKLVNKVRK